MRRRLALLPLVLSLLAPAWTAAAQDETESPAEEALAKTVDVILVRPAATVRVVAGAVLFVPSSLFALPSVLFASPGSRWSTINEAYEILIDEPVEYAFNRELGDF